jgi:hypothetical protein
VEIYESTQDGEKRPENMAHMPKEGLSPALLSFVFKFQQLEHFPQALTLN